MIEIFGKQVPTELEELVVPARTALLIIDMQNDCCSPGGSTDTSGGDISMYGEICPRIASFASVCRSLGVLVVNVGMRSLPDGLSDSPAWLRFRLRVSKSYDPSSTTIWNSMIEGTWGAEFVPELMPQVGDVQVLKYRSSALHNTNLDLILRSHGVDGVLVSGCETEGCVESTVRDLCFYDYFPIVLSDCVASGVPELHEASMRVMSAYRTDVATSDEVATIWRGAERPARQPLRRS